MGAPPSPYTVPSEQPTIYLPAKVVTVENLEEAFLSKDTTLPFKGSLHSQTYKPLGPQVEKESSPFQLISNFSGGFLSQKCKQLPVLVSNTAT